MHVGMAAVDTKRCAYFVQKRGRNCRMLATKGSIYCGEHVIHDKTLVTDVCSGSDQPRHRVLCPLDPSHTVFEDSLQKHLKKCNAAKKTKPLCYLAHINTGLKSYQPSEEERLPLSAFPTKRVQDLVKKIEAAYQEHFTEIKMQILSHPAMVEDLADPRNGATALKHLQQQSSILAHLDALGILFSKDVCYIEFGAGRGKLSECIQKSFQKVSSTTSSSVSNAEVNDHTSQLISSPHAGSPLACVAKREVEPRGEVASPPELEAENSQEARNVHYILVDRESCRHKVDGCHRVSSLVGAQYHRLLMDIEHLDLRRLECLNEGSEVKGIVAVSKHLCGAATDLSLRCLVQSLLNVSGKNSHASHLDGISFQGQIKTKLRGVLIALCCHHRCSWPQLVGRNFFEKLGFTPVDFHLVCHMSSWAVCGVRPPAKSPCSGDTNESGSKESIGALSNLDVVPGTTEGERCDVKPRDEAPSGNTKKVTEHTRWGYVPHPNEEIGLKCKRLIDLARLTYLEENGLKAWLVYYVDRSTSLENVLLIAVPRSS